MFDKLPNGDPLKDETKKIANDLLSKLDNKPVWLVKAIIAELSSLIDLNSVIIKK